MIIEINFLELLTCTLHPSCNVFSNILSGLNSLNQFSVQAPQLKNRYPQISSLHRQEHKAEKSAL